MSFNFNGVKVDSVLLNGAQVEEVQLSGTTVWRRATTMTYVREYIATIDEEWWGFNHSGGLGSLTPRVNHQGVTIGHLAYIIDAYMEGVSMYVVNVPDSFNNADVYDSVLGLVATLSRTNPGTTAYFSDWSPSAAVRNYFKSASSAPSHIQIIFR